MGGLGGLAAAFGGPGLGVAGVMGEDIWVDPSSNLFGAHSITAGMIIEIAIRNQLGVIDGTGMLHITTVLPPSAVGVCAVP